MLSVNSLRDIISRTLKLSTTASPSAMASRLFSTTSAPLARQVAKPASGGAQANVRRSRKAPRSENYYRIKILKQNMFSPAPPPLRMARLRYLRHWTIHRAWQLFRRQQHETIAKERNRMHAGMYNACEELRQTMGPGSRSEGYLYRVAMEKKGVYGVNGVPIEYARFQSDTPAKKAWDHDWKR